MRNKLIIIGAGNVGGFLSYNIDDFGHFDVLGFLDDDQEKVGHQIYGRNVLGTTDEIGMHLSDRPIHLAVGISSPKAKKRIIEKLAKYPLIYPNFISPRVWLSRQVKIGKGVILYPGVSVNYGANIGDFVIMNMNCAIGHDCTIADYSSLAPGVNLAGFTAVEEGANIGIGVSTKQNVRIGKYSTIGGQSMLVKDAPGDSVVVGIPGNVLK